MLDLDAIEARAKAATPGPWAVTGATIIYSRLGKATVAEVSELDEKERYVRFRPVELGSERFNEACANATLIAHAREDIPALIAELRKLREENRWILVTERLPEDKGYVLCGYGSGVLAAWFDGVRLDIDGVTHWRPLPKPPEVG